MKGALLGASLTKGAGAALKRLRELNGTHRQPLLISQLFTAKPDYWGAPKPTQPSWSELEAA